MTQPLSDAMVFFGATGDLAHKKIFPALQALVKRGHLNVPVIGVAKQAGTSSNCAPARGTASGPTAAASTARPSRQTDGKTDGQPAAAPTEPTYRFVTAPMPKEIVPRGILAPSMIAHVLAIKYVLGVPF